MAVSGRHLVLGAGGFLGRHLVRGLAAEGLAVTAAGRSPHLARHAVESVAADLFLLDADGLADLAAGHAVVHHLAWSTVPATSDADPEADLRDNVGLTVRLLEACRRVGARLVFASSGGAVYGATAALRIREDHPLNPLGPTARPRRPPSTSSP